MRKTGGRAREIRRIVAMLRPYAVGEGNRLAAGIALSVAIVALHVVRPWPLKWILDFLAKPDHRGAVDTGVASAPTRGLLLLSLLFVALALAAAWADFAQTLVLNGLGARAASAG